jgi:hypothetical protein
MNKSLFMKYSKIFLGVLSALLFLAIGCKNNDSSVRNEARESLGIEADETQTPAVTPPASTTTTTSAVAGNVPHYICANNCVGSGGASAGNCPVCGDPYTHNQAYHNQTTTTTPSTSPITTTPITTTPQTTTPPTPPAATNAAGVYHYTCSNGCAGGSGSQGVCATCGNPLAHNTAYHQ